MIYLVNSNYQIFLKFTCFFQFKIFYTYLKIIPKNLNYDFLFLLVLYPAVYVTVLQVYMSTRLSVGQTIQM